MLDLTDMGKRARAASYELANRCILDGSDVIPGFTLKVSDIFPK
jgi:hypothetical protein